jgi:hypothetical protein
MDGWVYSQNTGILSHGGEPIGKGYSGRGQGLNNSKMEMVHSVGPLPRGTWEIGMFFDDKHLGPCVAALRPTDQDIYGRGGFFIHGDNKLVNFTASDGCIILPRKLREAIRDSKEKYIAVKE